MKEFKDTNYGNLTGKTFKGDVFIHWSQLTSLKGAPKIVKGDFNCSINKLKNLKYAPQIVEGKFICHDNILKTLEGLPKKIGGEFNCTYNPDLNPKNSWEYIFQSDIKGKIEADFQVPTKEDYELYKTVKGDMNKFWEIYDMKELLK